MERQRSQSAWVRGFFWTVLWASRGRGSAARRRALADAWESLIGRPSKVVSLGALGYARRAGGVDRASGNTRYPGLVQGAVPNVERIRPGERRLGGEPSKAHPGDLGDCPPNSDVVTH